MIIMHRRKCGTPRGGLYAVGEMGPGGTLEPCTALVAPLEAEVTNPRAAEKVHIDQTLTSGFGLVPPDGHEPTRFAGLPVVGLADLWGKSAGYRTAWDVLEETMAKGIARRIPKVPDVTLPCPVLMMHMDAVIKPKSQNGRNVAVDMALFDSPALTKGSWAALVEQPWLEAESLGRAGDETYLDHLHVHFWSAWRNHIFNEPGSYAKHELKRMEIDLVQGIIGIGWINAFVQVLEPDQYNVDPKLAAQGVVPGLAPNDPRVQDYE